VATIALHIGAVCVKSVNFSFSLLSDLLLRYFMYIREATMGMADFQALFKALAQLQALFKALAQLQLSADELACLQNFIQAAVLPGQCFTLIEEAAGMRACPHCAGSRCHRCGQANGLQRFRCLGCKRSFNALTGTPLARLRLRDKWLPYLQCLIESATVRAAAKRVAVAKSTSFRWRHRFLAAVRRAPLPKLSGIVEVDETSPCIAKGFAEFKAATSQARRQGGAARYQRGIRLHPGGARPHPQHLRFRDGPGTGHSAAADDTSAAGAGA
jgi:transposase-like protein